MVVPGLGEGRGVSVQWGKNLCFTQGKVLEMTVTAARHVTVPQALALEHGKMLSVM